MEYCQTPLQTYSNFQAQEFPRRNDVGGLTPQERSSSMPGRTRGAPFPEPFSGPSHGLSFESSPGLSHEPFPGLSCGPSPGLSRGPSPGLSRGPSPGLPPGSHGQWSELSSRPSLGQPSDPSYSFFSHPLEKIETYFTRVKRDIQRRVEKRRGELSISILAIILVIAVAIGDMINEIQSLQ